MGLTSTIELEGRTIAHREAVSHPSEGAEQIMALSTWMVVLATVRLVCAIANYAMATLETWRLGPASIARWRWFFEENPPILLLAAAWPLVLGLALRRTRWPELLKAAALTFLILSIGGILSMIADWSELGERWIHVGSFRIARQALSHPDLSVIPFGLLGAVQLLLEFGTAGGAVVVAFRTPDALSRDSDRHARVRRSRYSGLAICLAVGFLIVTVRLPAGTAYLEILNQSRWIREFLLRDDLRRIRSTRRPAPSTPETIRIHEVEVLLYEASRAWESEQYSQSWDSYHRLIPMADSVPQSAMSMPGRRIVAHSYNGWAWLLATCPVANLRNPQDAVIYAKRAIDLESNNYQIWNTLGVAYFRDGNWEEARSALYRSMELNDEGGAFDWFFLAMIHAKFGHMERAHDWYDKAVQWSHDRGGDSVELYRFQVEAAEVLGLPKPERILTATPSKVARPPHTVYPWVIQRKGRGQLLSPNQPEN